ncbi:pyridoxamine 5'-phosphate oxidase family protein [Arthrobacter pigmenti]
MTTETSGAVVSLSSGQCWEFLQRMVLGRLAVSAAGTIDILPINYVVHQDKIYFRTAPGTKLASLTVNRNVAFEVDEVRDGTAKSVVVHGTARELDRSAEKDEIDALPLTPWIPTLKYSFVEITPTDLTGRQFDIAPEPERY